MSSGIDPNSPIGRLIKDIHDKLLELEYGIGALSKKYLESPAESRRKKIGNLFKGAGFMVLFGCWIIEHIQINYWESQKSEFVEKRDLFLHDIQTVNTFFIATADRLVSTQTEDRQRRLRNFEMATYSEDVQTLDDDLANLAHLDRDNYSDDKIRNDTAGSAEATLNLRNANASGDTSKLMAAFNYYIDAGRKNLIVINDVTDYENKIDNRLKNWKWFFVGMYLLSAAFLSFSWICSKNWWNIESRIEKNAGSWNKLLKIFNLL